MWANQFFSFSGKQHNVKYVHLGHSFFISFLSWYFGRIVLSFPVLLILVLKFLNSEIFIRPALGKLAENSIIQHLKAFYFCFSFMNVFSAGVYRCHTMLRCSLMQTDDLMGTLIVIFSSIVPVISVFL